MNDLDSAMVRGGASSATKCQPSQREEEFEPSMRQELQERTAVFKDQVQRQQCIMKEMQEKGTSRLVRPGDSLHRDNGVSIAEGVDRRQRQVNVTFAERQHVCDRNCFSQTVFGARVVLAQG